MSASDDELAGAQPMIGLFEITIAVCTAWIIVSEVLSFVRGDRWLY
jgi:hypothetical protein